ncbi:unnamed protein product [Darwinula stevensoni]|uniref:C-type lectin domain-containing protein n=1 Tax=Darwinula stevensoni TaxID=69355 RepID=A0A7R9ACQ4_9CRUS|nr:unnamed protein product [Darwinula stevensoni]CAG0900236.1 unnamed protein product [Darwinula stevensoni]
MFHMIDGLSIFPTSPLCAQAECAREQRCLGFALKKGDDSFICQLLSKNSTFAVDPNKTSRISVSEKIAPKEFEFAMVTGKIHFLRAMGIGPYTAAKTTCKGDGLAHLVMDDRGQEWHDYVLQFMESHFPSQDKFWIGADDIDWDDEFFWVDSEETAGSFHAGGLRVEARASKGGASRRSRLPGRRVKSNWENPAWRLRNLLTPSPGVGAFGGGGGSRFPLLDAGGSELRRLVASEGEGPARFLIGLAGREFAWPGRVPGFRVFRREDREAEFQRENGCHGFALKKVQDSFISQLLSKNSTIAVDTDKTYWISVSGTLVADSMKTFWLLGEPNFQSGNQNARCVAMVKYKGGKWEDVSFSKTLPIICEIRLP